jgi:hypothetical protein
MYSYIAVLLFCTAQVSEHYEAHSAAEAGLAESLAQARGDLTAAVAEESSSRRAAVDALQRWFDQNQVG